MRDVTSGAFAPRYTPHNRVVAIHGPNRIVITDEKGNESVRRASHLKHCDSKSKFASMVPENNEYGDFGRSTKLLLHPKDVPELHFPRENNTNSKEQVVINNITESLAEVASKRHETSEIPSKSSTNYNDNAGESQTKQIDKPHGIPLVKRDISTNNNRSEPQKENWFTFPAISVSKLSNALKEGMFGKQEGCPTDMATHSGPVNENTEFSFFL